MPQSPADSPQEEDITDAPESPQKEVPRKTRSGHVARSESEGVQVPNEAESGRFSAAMAAAMTGYSELYPPSGQVGHGAQGPMYLGPTAPPPATTSFGVQLPAAASDVTGSIQQDLIQMDVGGSLALSNLKAAAVQALRECRGPFDQYRPKTVAQMKLDIAIRSVRLEAQRRITAWDEDHSTHVAPEQKQLDTVREIYRVSAVCSVNTSCCRRCTKWSGP